jgi:hypothetical protein
VNQAVGPGDLFLFFGWFCPVDDRAGGRLGYRGRAAQVQAMWGWMEIGAVLPADEAAGDWPGRLVIRISWWAISPATNATTPVSPSAASSPLPSRGDTGHQQCASNARSVTGASR